MLAGTEDEGNGDGRMTGYGERETDGHRVTWILLNKSYQSEVRWPMQSVGTADLTSSWH